MLGEVGPQDTLQRGIVLRGYSIRSVLGRGGFGIVYRARHIELGYLVAIKEYLPGELATRVGLLVKPKSTACIEPYSDGLRRFRDEGKALVELHDHPNVVSCRDFFRCHGTAYLVMEFVRGMPLSRHLQQREAEGRPFGEEDLMALAIPLIEGLRRVHEAGIVHRDIKPANVLLREENRQPVLIDFGAAKQDWANHTKSVAPRTPGYAAWEQVVPEGNIGSWTDIYAIGVLFWRIVSGGAPDAALGSPVAVESRMDALVRGMSEPMPSARRLGEGRFNASALATIDSCLKLRHDERVQDCAELLHLIRGDEDFQYRLGMKYFRTAAEPQFSNPEHDNVGGHKLHQYVQTDLFKWYRFMSDHGERIRKQSSLLSQSAEWLTLAAHKRQNDAQHQLAFMTFYGIGIDRSIPSAMKWWYKAAKLGNTEAQYTIGVIWTKTYVYAKYGDECGDFDRFGGSDTYLLNEENYGTNYVKTHIPHEAARWLCKAAEGGHFNAQVVMEIYSGKNYYMSNPPPFAEVQFELAKVYHKGEDVPRSYTRALTWYRTAAQWISDKFDQVHQRASMKARKNVSKLIDEYLASHELVERISSNANRGDPTSQYNLGWMYSTGTNVETNHRTAVFWYRLAAQQGDVAAQNNLGVCYMLGYGVPQDRFKALRWFQLATDSRRWSPHTYSSMGQFRWEDDAATACFRLAVYRRSKSIRGGIAAIYNHRSMIDFNSTQCYLQDTSRAEYNLGIALLLLSENDRSIYFDVYRGDADDKIEQELGHDLASEYGKCFKLAAYYDHSNAQYQLGNKQLISDQNRCSDESMKWFKLSAEQDHIGSLYMLASHYREHNEAVAMWATECYHNAVEKLLLARKSIREKIEIEMHREAINWYVSGGLRCEVPAKLRLDLLYDVGDNHLEGYDWLNYSLRFDSVDYDFLRELFRESDCDGETHFLRGLYEQIYTGSKHNDEPKDMFRIDESFQHFKRATKVGSRQEKHEFGEIDFSSGHPRAMNNLGIIYALSDDDVRDQEAAVAEFLRAAECGHPAAQFNLGVCYSKGIGVLIDQEKAFRWFRKCAESTEHINCRRVADCSLMWWPHAHNYPPLVDALFNLGTCHLEGIGTSIDVDACMRYFSLVAQTGDRTAFDYLAPTRISEILLRWPSQISGEISDRDLSSAQSVQSRVCHRVQGDLDMEDCAVLGWRYAIGYGVKKDAIRAFGWFLKASRTEEDADRDIRGVSRSMSGLGWPLTSGSRQSTIGLDLSPRALRRIKTDWFADDDVSGAEISAARICRSAAELGDPDAQYFYAWMCAGSEATEGCLVEALRWYRLAAIQGHVSASYRLALMYDEGRGVSSDPAEAAKWYEVSAKEGLSDAQYRLGLLYECGRGVRQDRDVAAEWYEIAAADGDLLSKYRLWVIAQADHASSCSSLCDCSDLYYEILRDREESDLDWNAQPLDDEIQPSGFRLTVWDDPGGS